MTLAQNRIVENWTAAPATAHDYPLLADFLATTEGLAGRKFAADSRDIAEQLDGAFPGAVTVVRDASERVRGYAVLHQPHGLQPKIAGDFVFHPDTSPAIVDEIVGEAVTRFHREAAAIPGAYLRVFVGTDQQPAIEALTRHGARQEGQFIRTRKPLGAEDPRALDAAAIGGLTLLSWPEVTSRGCSSRCVSCSSTPFWSTSATCPRHLRCGNSTSKVAPLHPISVSPRSPTATRWWGMCSAPPTPPVSVRPKSAAPTPTTSGCAAVSDSEASASSC